MASVPPEDDGTINFAANPSHDNLDTLSYFAAADPGPSDSLSFPGDPSVGSHFPEPSDLYGDYHNPLASTQYLTETHAAAPVDPQKPLVCQMPKPNGETCSEAFSRKCDLK